MKALSLTQPWASLVAKGAKKIETRSWATSYRGPLAIHASKSFPTWAREMVYDKDFILALFGCFEGSWKRLPTGAVLAICELVDVIRIDEAIWFPACKGIGTKRQYWELSKQERAFGDYSIGRHAWLLANIVPLPEPIPAKGALQLWEWNT